MPTRLGSLLVGFFLFKVLRLPLIGMVGSTLLFGVLSGLI